MQRTSDISWRSLFCELCYQHNSVDICLCECAGCMPKSTDAASTDGNAFPADELVRFRKERLPLTPSSLERTHATLRVP